MDQSNYTPISTRRASKKGSSPILKMIGYLISFVLLVGVVAGFIAVMNGFNFQSRAANKGGGLTKYGWNAKTGCFTKLSTIKYAARYQCPGKIGMYGSGCDPKHGGRQTGSWKSAAIKTMVKNGKSQVCIIPYGSSTPKDSKGCFTQQLDIDTGNGGGPEGWYSFDRCTKVTPTPTPVCIQPTPPACPNGTLVPVTPSPIVTDTPICSQWACVTNTPTPTGVCVKPLSPKVRIDCPLCGEQSSSTQ